jgi:hypothetical protein
MTMMKNLLLVVSANLLLVFQGTFAEGACAKATLTFNFKPKFPYGISTDYVCRGDSIAPIQDILSPTVKSVLEGMDYTIVDVGDLSTGVDCPPHSCGYNPGNKCSPHCLPVEFCADDEEKTKKFPAEHLGKLGEDLIDALRPSLPDCLGVKGKFMLDAHLDFEE